MADSARIEDLRKRYRDNPRRFFAPLANEYRKSGFLDRAILLCEKHLAEQPDSMNGLIVYGQTLFEAGRPEEARAPFARALKLDPENLIALRQLGDIARIAGDVPTAKGWYDKVLEFDRRNNEVLGLLEQMGVGASKEVPTAPRSATRAPLVSVAPTVSVSDGDGVEVGIVDRRGSLLDVKFDFGEPVEAPPAVPLPSAPLTRADAAEDGFAAARPIELPWRDTPSQEQLIEPARAPSAPSAPSAPHRPRMTRADLASLPLLADFGLDDDDAVRRGTPLATPEVPGPIAIESPVAEEPRASQRTLPFVTETMATLYLQQGFRENAINVYRQLVAQSPEDAALRQKLVELEQAPSDMPEFEVPSVESPEPEPAPANAMLNEVSFADVGLAMPWPSSSRTPLATPVVVASPTAREFFAGIARRGFAAAATVAAVGASVPSVDLEAATPATEEPASVTGWPLDALFGAATEVRDLRAAEVLAGIATFTGPTGGTGLEQLFAEAPSAPAAPVARRTVPRASQLLKFEQFFSAPPAASEASVEPPAPVTPGPVAERAQQSASSGDDDLDQFHGWLQALKR